MIAASMGWARYSLRRASHEHDPRKSVINSCCWECQPVLQVKAEQSFNSVLSRFLTISGCCAHQNRQKSSGIQHRRASRSTISGAIQDRGAVSMRCEPRFCIPCGNILQNGQADSAHIRPTDVSNTQPSRRMILTHRATQQMIVHETLMDFR